MRTPMDLSRYFRHEVVRDALVVYAEASRHPKSEWHSEHVQNLLNALDQDLEIVIRTKPHSRRDARILVTAA